MNQIIKPKSVNFKELVKNSKTTLTLDCQSDMIELLNQEFTEEQSQWYIANLYMYLNFDPTTDFPINLDNVFKMIGFANKGNAMKTIKSNFTIEEDYKISLIPKEKSSWGGSGGDKVMLNVDTFKNLCMIAKTNKGKEIRKYYVKLENIHNKIIKKEIENTQKLLENKTNEMQLLELNLEEKNHKINLMTRKVNKYKKGESVYIFHSTVEEDDKVIDLYKLGRTKNANVRDQIHKTASYKGILLQIHCVDSVLLERNLHFLLNKYRKANRREWFTCSFDIMKNAIDYAKYVLESDIDFENFDIKNISIPIINNNDIIIEETLQKLAKNIFTTLEYEQVDINNFEMFINEYCDFSETGYITHLMLKDQYKIWSKTANYAQLKKLMDYCKDKFVTFTNRANPLVSTSKLTLCFRGISLKKSLFKFELCEQNLIIENYLYQNCQRAPGFRVTMQDLNNDFEKWLMTTYQMEFTYLIKEKIKTYLDTRFIRLRTGDESGGKDLRLGGWLGFALKTNEVPEPIKQYKPKNAKKILQKNLNNEIIKEWHSVRDLTFYLNKSNTVTSNIVNTHKPIIINEIQYTFEFK
jgi:phage anti-repressor protein